MHRAGSRYDFPGVNREGRQTFRLPLFDASILLLIAVELLPLLSINFVSVKLFKCYYCPSDRRIDTSRCSLKGDINYNYY